MSPAQEVNPQKARKGLNRVLHAGGYSIQGLHAGWGETAFRQEAILSMALVPLAFWLGQSWVEVALLAGSVVMVMVVVLRNNFLFGIRNYERRTERTCEKLN